MAIDLSKLSFYSGTRYEYVASKSSTSFSIPAGGFPSVVIAHNLGYRPYYRLWYSFTGTGNTYQLFPGSGSYNIDFKGVQVDNVTVDATNITIAFQGVTNPGTVTGTIYYRIYAEPQA